MSWERVVAWGVAIVVGGFILGLFVVMVVENTREAPTNSAAVVAFVVGLAIVATLVFSAITGKI